MFDRIKRWFNHGPKGKVIYPFRALVGEMRNKDPVLFDEIRLMPPAIAVQRWREVYPEDFQ